MAKCTFCGAQIPQGEGIIYVEISGKIINYCSSKCRKNREMGRDPGKMKWITKADHNKEAKKTA
jgi:large subunit ribosomal protein L24e